MPPPTDNNIEGTDCMSTRFDVAARLKALPPYLFGEIDRKKKAAVAAGRMIAGLVSRVATERSIAHYATPRRTFGAHSRPTEPGEATPTVCSAKDIPLRLTSWGHCSS